MASENAKAVADEVIQKVRKGEKVNMQDIQKKHGYSDRSAKSMKAKRTKTYKKAMSPILKRMEAHRRRIMNALDSKDLSKERFKDLSDALAKTTHDIQLLSGGKTSNDKVEISWSD
jgi:hypothetical protein